MIARLPALPFILLVRLYQVILSPFMGGYCRFQPTCSQYAIEALQMRGVLKGGWLAVRRILRCHPWGGFGYDPVPMKSIHHRDTENTENIEGSE